MEEKLRYYIVRRNKKEILKLKEKYGAAALAKNAANLETPYLIRLLLLLGDKSSAEILSQLHPQTSAGLLLKLGKERAADLLEEISPDEATDIVEELPFDEASEILAVTQKSKADQIHRLLNYPKESAGSVMSPLFVALKPEWEVEKALAFVHSLAQKMEAIYYLYVTDENKKLLGVFSLRELILAPKGKKVKDVMHTQLFKGSVYEDQEKVARKILENKLTALPIVDRENHLLGVVSRQIAEEIIEEETSEDIERIGGAQPLEAPYAIVNVFSLVKKRAGWLFIFFVAEMFTANVLKSFQSTLTAVVALSFFIPLLIGTGGNIGSQTVTTIVRALAVGEVKFRDFLKVVWKEAGAGCILGIFLGAIIFIRTQFWGGSPALGLTVALSLFAISLYASIIGAVIPLSLHRFKLDPAVVSAPFITTLIDSIGLLFYFLLAKLILNI